MRFALGTLTAVLAFTSAADAEPERFVQTLQFGPQYQVVVAQGDREPASVGSYSVRLYRNLETGELLDGTIKPRDGSLWRAWVQKCDGSYRLLVQTVSAGSGSYVTTDRWHLAGDAPSLQVERIQDVVAPDERIDPQSEAGCTSPE